MELLQTTTTAKGVEIRVGDIVRVKGSKVDRKVMQILSEKASATKGNVRCVRLDDGPAHSAWANENRLIVIERAAA